MRILTYKRTHIGDPDQAGRFGIYDCMVKIRDYEYDAVIGVGGVGAEPRGFGIVRKINWVGINPTKSGSKGNRGFEVTFEYFLLLEEHGPLLEELAPSLAKRMFEGGARILLSGYSADELSEAKKILEWSKNQSQPHTVGISRSGDAAGCKGRCKPVAEPKPKR
jgi:hypothetical protein